MTNRPPQFEQHWISKTKRDALAKLIALHYPQLNVRTYRNRSKGDSKYSIEIRVIPDDIRQKLYVTSRILADID